MEKQKIDELSHAMLSRSYQKGYYDCIHLVVSKSMLAVRAHSVLGTFLHDLKRSALTLFEAADKAVTNMQKEIEEQKKLAEKEMEKKDEKKEDQK